MTRLTFGLAAIVLIASVTAAEEDEIGPALEKAQSRYDAEIEKLNSALLGSLQRKKDAFEKAGDKQGAERIDDEIGAFEKNRQLPMSVPTVDFKKRRQSLRSGMETAYKKAVKQYTQQKERELADAVEKRLLAFYKENLRVWQHRTGRFFRTGENDWTEQMPDGKQITFKEIGRTRDYVELESPEGSPRIKIHAERCDVSFHPFTETKTFYRGQWND
jgi:hypothetical protein